MPQGVAFTVEGEGSCVAVSTACPWVPEDQGEMPGWQSGCYLLPAFEPDRALWDQRDFMALPLNNTERKDGMLSDVLSPP